jgi:hypothetical protein
VPPVGGTPASKGGYSIGSGKGASGTRVGGVGGCEGQVFVVQAKMEGLDLGKIDPKEVVTEGGDDDDNCNEGDVQEVRAVLMELLELRGHAEGLQDLAAKSKRKQRKVLRGYLGRLRGRLTPCLEQLCEPDELRALLAGIDLLLE